MSLPDIIQNSIDYIEHNLKSELSLAQLAKDAGYSLFHYSRLFTSAVGSSAAEYILRRRLDHAIAEIADGRKAIDVILEYGFDTYSGFYKAFLKRYGCSPKKYLSIYLSHKIQQPEVVTIYSQNELRTVLENWDLPRNLKITGVPSAPDFPGKIRVWKIGEEYMLKAGEKAALQKEIMLAKKLMKQDFMAAIPLPTIQESEYLEKDTTFILVHTIPGAPLSPTKRLGSDSASYAHAYGKAIAGLHKALIQVEKEGELFDETTIYADVMNWAIPEVKQLARQWNMDLPETFYSDYEQQAGHFASLPVQLIHRDPNPGNILFENDKITGFVDFDLNERNIRIFDPCYCATGLLSELSDINQGFPKWLEILQGILHGYDSLCPLTEEEKSAVYYTICSIQLIFIAYLKDYPEFSTMAAKNREILQQVIEHKKDILNIY